MRTDFSMQSAGGPARVADDHEVSVAISASPALRTRIERLARRAGALVIAESAKFEVLLLAMDASTSALAATGPLNPLSATQTKVCVIWCTAEPRPNQIVQMMRTGISGIVSIDIAAAKFKATLNAISNGLRVVDPALLREDFQAHANSSREELTHREQEVLKMMGDGLSNKEISSRLGISTHTVKFHISSILGKLGAASRTEAVSIGVRTGKLTI